MQVKRLTIVRIRSYVCAAAALLLWMSSDVPAGATIALDGVLNAVADASINGDRARDLQREHWTGTPKTLATNVLARATFGPEFVTASGNAVATWNSADNGSVFFRNYGWHFMNPQHAALADLSHKLEVNDWSYTFRATSDGVFAMNWDIRLVSGNGFGLKGWTISWTGADATGYTQPDLFNPTESGIFEGAVRAGRFYTIAIQGDEDFILRNGGVAIQDANYSGYMNGAFSWSISSVPEPSTWAMMLLGLAGLGYFGYCRSGGGYARRSV
ncbi:PEP-CTERM sorting domain-containing protein [Bradyrhizobium guangdongense]